MRVEPGPADVLHVINENVLPVRTAECEKNFFNNEFQPLPFTANLKHSPTPGSINVKPHNQNLFTSAAIPR